jgi:hypothetical protein
MAEKSGNGDNQKKSLISKCLSEEHFLLRKEEVRA